MVKAGALSGLVVGVLLGFTQDPGENLRIERAAARFARVEYAASSRGLEPSAREFATPHAPTGPASLPYRDRAHLLALADDAGATLLQAPDSIACTLPLPLGCVEVVLRIGIPRVTGDSATVWLYALERIHRAEVDQLLLVRKTAGEWAVERSLEMREGFLGRRPPGARESVPLIATR